MYKYLCKCLAYVVLQLEFENYFTPFFSSGTIWVSMTEFLGNLL